jgi:hypothetical protein
MKKLFQTDFFFEIAKGFADGLRVIKAGNVKEGIAFVDQGQIHASDDNTGNRRDHCGFMLVKRISNLADFLVGRD